MAWKNTIHDSNAVKALADIANFKTLAVVPDLPKPSPDHQHYKILTLSRLPVDLSAVASWAALAVSHGGHGTAARALVQGIPLVSCPITLEQVMLANRVEAADAGVTLREGANATEMARQIAHAFEQQTGRRGASVFNEMHHAAELKTGEALLAELI